MNLVIFATANPGNDIAMSFVLVVLMGFFTTGAALCTYFTDEYHIGDWLMLVAWTTICALMMLCGSVQSEKAHDGRALFLLAYLPSLAASCGPILRCLERRLRRPGLLWSIYLVSFSIGHFFAWYGLGLFSDAKNAALATFVLAPVGGVLLWALSTSLAFVFLKK